MPLAGIYLTCSLLKNWWPPYLCLPWSFIQSSNHLWQRWGHRDIIWPLYQAELLMAVSDSQFQVGGERKRELEYISLQRPKVFLFWGLARLRNFKCSYRRNLFPSVLFSILCLGLLFLLLYVLSLFSRRVSPCRSKASATSIWQFYQLQSPPKNVTPILIGPSKSPRFTIHRL